MKSTVIGRAAVRPNRGARLLFARDNSLGSFAAIGRVSRPSDSTNDLSIGVRSQPESPKHLIGFRSLGSRDSIIIEIEGLMPDRSRPRRTELALEFGFRSRRKFNIGVTFLISMAFKSSANSSLNSASPAIARRLRFSHIESESAPASVGGFDDRSAKALALGFACPGGLGDDFAGSLGF